MKPLWVRVGEGGMTLRSDDDRRSYGYGYSLVLLADGVDESTMTLNNGSFHWTEKLEDGLWSNFQFH